MARHRKTLALIIIFLPILVTVITAFRVRDLPNTLQDSFKSELKKRKCVDCDVDDVKDKHSVKIESATKRYEDLKRAVREKQHELHQKVPVKPNPKIIDDNVNNNRDDDDKLLESVKKGSSLKKEEHSKPPKTKKEESFFSKFSFFSYDDDDNDDDDDDDDNEESVSTDSKILKSVVRKEKNDDLQNENDDDDDDDDDDDNDYELKAKNKNVEKTERQKNEESHKKYAALKENDDDGEDDDDDGLNGKKKKHQKTEKQKHEEIHNKHLKNKSNKLDVDYDSEDKNDHKKSVKPIPKSIPEQNVKNLKTKELTRNKLKLDNDNDDDDDDDQENYIHDKSKEKIKKEKTDSSTKQKADVSVKKKIEDDQGKKDVKDDKTKNASKNTESKSKAESKPLAVKPKKGVDDDEDDDDNMINELKKIVTHKNAKEAPSSSAHKQDQKTEKEKSELKPSIKESTVPKQSEPVKKESQKPTPKHEDKNFSVKSKEDLGKEIKHVKETNPKADSKKVEEKAKSKTEKVPLKGKSSAESLIGSHEIYSNKPQDDRIKHVTDALYRRNLLVSEFEDFYAFFPTFAPNFSKIHNPECRRHGQILLRQLRGTKLWALNMLDATAKIPSGILQGNTIQLGDFDQCLNSRAKVQLDTGSVVKVEGKYCLATLDVKAEHEELEVPVHLAQAKNLIKSRIDDPGHFVPRFSTLSWGVCMPATCDPQDVEVAIRDAVKHYQHRSGFVIKVKVDEDDCHTHEPDWWEDWLELPTVLTLSFYGIILLLVLIATVRDFLARKPTEESSQAEGDEQTESEKEKTPEAEEKQIESKGSDGVLSAFSLYRTVEKLTAAGTEDEICCIHGVRALATLALLLAHNCLPVAATPYTNRLKITEVVSSGLWSWARAGWMYTDCFLLLSGALTAHRMAESESGALWRLFTRYLRLTPALLAVVLFYAYVWDLIGEGPMWGTLVTKNARACEESWWWNLLYVHNWFGLEEMCAPQTHQLALDMQLTILGGVIVWAMQVQHWATHLLMPTLHAAAAYSRYTTVRDHRLTLIAYHGVTVSQLYRTARLSYTSVFHRSTAYLIGLSLGLLLKKPAEHGMLVTIVGWMTSIALWSAVWWAGWDAGSTSYHYSATEAAQYAALAPIASALAIAWVIYAVHNSSGFLLSLLSCRPLVLVSRLSYALYLCQFIVFFTNTATVRTSSEFTIMSLIDVKEISYILLTSTILTLTLVLPMQSLHKLFVFSSQVKSNEESKEGGEEQNEAAEKVEEEDNEKEKNHVEEILEMPQVRQVQSRQSLLAHREMLEEIPEVEVEYEAQRDMLEGLEEILEEEEDGEEMENDMDMDDDLEIIEEEEAEGGEDFWAEREEEHYTPRRSFSRADDNDGWEWSANGDRGAQSHRYAR